MKNLKNKSMAIMIALILTVSVGASMTLLPGRVLNEYLIGQPELSSLMLCKMRWTRWKLA